MKSEQVSRKDPHCRQYYTYSIMRDLLEIGIRDALVTGYIDDVAIMIRGGSIALNNSVLAAIYQKAARWAQKHASVFTP